MAPPLPLDLHKLRSEKHISPFHKLFICIWHCTWQALTIHLLVIVNKRGDTGCKALTKTPWHNVWGCVNHAGATPDDPTNYSILMVSGISHLYLERDTAQHVNTWNHSEQRSWAVTEGPFTSRWLHRSTLMGCWFCHTSGGCWTQKSSHRNHPCSGVTWPPPTAADLVLCTLW